MAQPLIRFLRASFWIRWRMMAHALRSRDQDFLGGLASAGELLVPLLWAAVLIPTLAILTLGGYSLGLNLAGSQDLSSVALVIMRIVLALSTIAVVTAPMARSIHGAQVNINRLKLLPVPRSTLHMMEVLAALGDPWLAVVVPGLVAICVGLAVGGQALLALWMLLVAVALTLTLAILGSCCTIGSTVLFRDRRRAERVSLLLIFLVGSISIGPVLLERQFDRKGDEPGHTSGVVEQLRSPPSGFHWAKFLPSELYAGTLRAATKGEARNAVAHFGGLVIIGTLLFGLSSRLHRSSLDNVGNESRSRATRPVRLNRWRLPGVDKVTNSIAWTAHRNSLRTVRGRMGQWFAVPMLLVWRVIFRDEFSELESMLPQLAQGPRFALAAAGMSLLTLLPIMVNQFAIDRAGLTRQFLAPLGDRRLIFGKFFGSMISGGIALAIALVAAFVLWPSGSWVAWLGVLFACLGWLALSIAVCTLLAIGLPRSADISKLGKAGNPHPLAGLVGVFVVALSGLAPIAMFLVGQTFDSLWVRLGLPTAGALGCALACLPLLLLGVSMFGRQRQRLFHVASAR